MNRIYCWSMVVSATCLMAPVFSGNCVGAERPTFNKGTCDPRPDILPSWLLDCTAGEYRRIYNRPRYVNGWLAHVVEPSSQEAMVWCEAKQMGLYQKPHQPAMYKQYYVPKPWEILNTGPRPDYAKSNQSNRPLQLQVPPESDAGDTINDDMAANHDSTKVQFVQDILTDRH